MRDYDYREPSYKKDSRSSYSSEDWDDSPPQRLKNPWDDSYDAPSYTDNNRRRNVSSEHTASLRDEAKTAAAKRTHAKRKLKQLDIWIASLSGVLILCIITALFLPGTFAADPLPTPLTSSGLPAATGSEYDKNANSLPVSELVNTILPVTEDAGAGYVAETLFIGDSNTLRMMHYSDVTGITLKNCIGVEGMSIQAVPAFPCVKFKGHASLVNIPTAVKMMQPRRIILTFGTNNASGTQVDSFIASYETAINSIQSAYSYSSIIIASVPPIGQNSTYTAVSMTTIDKFNIGLAELAERMGLKFLNWSEVLKDENTGFIKAGYTDDGVHLTPEAMKVMFTYVRTHSYITEDTRPTPLAAIPERGETPPGLITGSSESKSQASSSSASSGSSSSKTGTVTVNYGIVDKSTGSSSGGVITVNGQTGTSSSAQVAPKGICPTVTATPNAGYRFLYWRVSEGGVPDDTNPTLANFAVYGTLKAGDTLSIIAVFEVLPVSSSPPAPQPVTVNVVAGEGGAASGGQQALPGATITITATPNSGYDFSNWSGAAVAAAGSATTTFTIPSDATGTITITANFSVSPAPENSP